MPRVHHRAAKFLITLAAGAAMFVPTIVQAAPSFSRHTSSTAISLAHSTVAQDALFAPRVVTRWSNGFLGRAAGSAQDESSGALRMRPDQVTSTTDLSISFPAQVQALGTDGHNHGYSVQTNNNHGNNVGDLAALDDPAASPAANFHSTHILQSGIQGAYLQAATLTIARLQDSDTNAVNPVTFPVFWLASYYGTQDQARARVQDFLDTSGGSCLQYSSVDTSKCIEAGVDFTVTDPNSLFYNEYVTAYAITVGNLVGELVFEINADSVANSDAVFTLFKGVRDSIFNNAVDVVNNANSGPGQGPGPGPGPNPVSTATATNTPVPPTATLRPTSTPRPTNTPTPAPPQIQISALHVLLATSKTKSVETTSLKSSLASGYFADVTYANAGANVPAADIAFSQNGKVFLTRHMQPVSTSARHIRFRIVSQQVGGAQNARFGDVEKFVSKKKKVHIAATVQVVLGTATDTGTVTFTVAPNCKTTKKGKVCK